MNRTEKLFIECHADRMPELLVEKEQVLELARAKGVSQKLDFGWP